MKLTSNWNIGRLFWRTFTKDDTVYIAGLREGFLLNGESVNYENPTGFFQMEVKRGDIFGPFLIPAGHVFNNDDEFIIKEDGQLVGIEDAANVSIDAGFKFEFYGAVTQFLSAGSADTTIKIISSLTQTTTSTNNHQTTINNSAINETGAQVGAETSASGKVNDIQIGVKVNGSISNKVTNKIERVVANSLNVSIATITSYSEEQSITLKAGKLTAITSSWQRRFVTGNVTVGHDFFQYDATLGYITSRQISEYASPDDLPPELMSEYKRQNPGYVPPGDIQSQRDWRWCHKCQGLFFSGGQSSVGSCPAGGQHDKTDSGNYTLAHNSPIALGQADWRWCHKCQGLFYSGGHSSVGSCPAGGQHERWVSGNYTLPHNSPMAPGQPDWRWCHKCQGLFYSGGHSSVGSCPAGDKHDKGVSGMYTLMHTPNP